ncbi:hypothetical protein MNBD_GAMMA25-993 [hydrothermal vent metagenome]|uniref:Lipoprotein n=1 Tax=hydrothermal vent metagenome TaxID=652676 RepID=A0A3B1BJ17_9ZZZZ
MKSTKLVKIYILIGFFSILQGCAFDISSLASNKGSYQNDVACIAIFTKISGMESVRSDSGTVARWNGMVRNTRKVMSDVYNTISAKRIDEDISNFIVWLDEHRTTSTSRTKSQPVGGYYTETTTIRESDYYWYLYIQENLPFCETRYYEKTKPYYDSLHQYTQ